MNKETTGTHQDATVVDMTKVTAQVDAVAAICRERLLAQGTTLDEFRDGLPKRLQRSAVQQLNGTAELETEVAYAAAVATGTTLGDVIAAAELNVEGFRTLFAREVVNPQGVHLQMSQAAPGHTTAILVDEYDSGERTLMVDEMEMSPAVARELIAALSEAVDIAEAGR